MIKWLLNWWRSYQFRLALKQGKNQKAQLILQQIDKAGTKLSWQEKLFKQKIKTEETLTFYKQEVAALSKKLQLALPEESKLKPNLEFISHIHSSFKFVECERTILHCTGIEQKVFNNLEINLVDFLETEFTKIPAHNLDNKLAEAIQDLAGLKQGIDPNYSCSLSPHIYLLKYFLENIYCSYLAWFLLYQTSLLPRNIKILDIAAGPGTTIYGLALLLFSTQGFFSLPQMHISYYSLEQQDQLQYRGLQFWRKYIESSPISINAYFRFNTVNIFDYDRYASKLPEKFFDFIVISHCFFYDPQARSDSHKIYQKIFQNNLTDDGYVLLIVQGRKLFTLYDVIHGEDLQQEQMVIQMFLEELGLKLEWYKYLTSTGKRTPIKSNFYQFARQNLSPQIYLTALKQKYLKQNYSSHYVLDDYLILAKR